MALFGAIEARGLSDNATHLRKEESEDNRITDLNGIDIFVTLYQGSTFTNLKTAINDKVATVKNANSAGKGLPWRLSTEFTHMYLSRIKGINLRSGLLGQP